MWFEFRFEFIPIWPFTEFVLENVRMEMYFVVTPQITCQGDHSWCIRYFLNCPYDKKLYTPNKTQEFRIAAWKIQ